MRSLTILALLLTFLFSVANTLSNYPILIVVSYDAFRYDYFNKNANPYMVKLREKGTYAEYMRNVFPTKTFPNHHSIATGLFAEQHGVVGKSFYDKKTKKMVSSLYELFHYDENVVPIWRHNEDQGLGRHSGCMMWPGGSFSYQNKMPTYTKSYDIDFDWYERIDIILSWIEDPEQPANLVMLYFEEPDTHGHVYGPDSQVTFDFLLKLDNVTFYLEKELERRGLTNKVNVIHLSDHGMVGVSPPNIIDITKFLPSSSTFNMSGSSPLMNFYPAKGLEDRYYDLLKDASINNGYFAVYRKEEMPESWHFKNNSRVPPILLIANNGYAFQDLAKVAKIYANIFNFTVTDKSVFGVHGYEPEVEEMRPFFMARGPRIKVNHTILPFDNVDLFNLFCEILMIPPTKNEGNLQNVQDMLVEYSSTPIPLFIVIVFAVCGGLLILLLMVFTAAIAIVIIKHQQSVTTTAALKKRFPQTFNHSKIEAQHLLEPEEA